MAEEQLSLMNQAIAVGNVVHADGSVVDNALEEGLVTENRNRGYRIEQDIPVMREDESILTNQVEGF